MMRMFAAMIRWFPITCVLFLAVAGGGGVNAQTDLIQGPWHLEGNATGDVNNIPVRVLYIPLTERERNAHPAEIPETGAFVNLNAITTVPDSDGNHVSRIEAVMVYEDEDASGGEDDNRIVSSSASESRVHVGESQDKLNATYINSGSEQPYEAVSQQLEFLEKFKQQLEERELKIREKELEQQAAERKRLNTDPDGRFHASDITPDHPLYHLSTPHAPRCMNDEQIRCCDGLAFGFEEGMERLKEAGKDWRVAQIWDGAVGYGCYDVPDYYDCPKDKIIACCYYDSKKFIRNNPEYEKWNVYYGPTAAGCYPAIARAPPKSSPSPSATSGLETSDPRSATPPWVLAAQEREREQEAREALDSVSRSHSDNSQDETPPQPLKSDPEAGIFVVEIDPSKGEPVDYRVQVVEGSTTVVPIYAPTPPPDHVSSEVYEPTEPQREVGHNWHHQVDDLVSGIDEEVTWMPVDAEKGGDIYAAPPEDGAFDHSSHSPIGDYYATQEFYPFDPHSAASEYTLKESEVYYYDTPDYIMLPEGYTLYESADSPRNKKYTEIDDSEFEQAFLLYHQSNLQIEYPRPDDVDDWDKTFRIVGYYRQHNIHSAPILEVQYRVDATDEELDASDRAVGRYVFDYMAGGGQGEVLIKRYWVTVEHWADLYHGIMSQKDLFDLVTNEMI